MEIRVADDSTTSGLTKRREHYRSGPAGSSKASMPPV